MNWTVFHNEFIQHLLHEYDKEDIRYVVIGDTDGFPIINKNKDVDIVIDKVNIIKANNILHRIACEFGFHFYSQSVFESIYCNTYYFINGIDDRSIKIDLLYGFVFRGAVLMSIDQMYESSILRNGVRVLDENMEGYLLWLKPLITGGYLKEKYRDKINQSIIRNWAFFKKNICSTFGVIHGSNIISIIENQGIDAITKDYNRLRVRSWMSSFQKRPLSTLSSYIKHYKIEFRRRITSSNNVFVSVVGPDGVGKTTFINHLRKQIALLFIKDSHTILIKHFRPHIFPNIKSLFRKSKDYVLSEQYSNPHRAEPAGFISTIIRLFYYWSDYVTGYWFITRRLLNSGHVIIYDRYIYDFIVDPRRSRLSAPLWLRKLFVFATPQPKIVFFLNTDPATVYQRKQELTENEIRRQLEAYRTLSNSAPDKFVIIDASMPTETQVSEAIAEIIQHTFKSLRNAIHTTHHTTHE